MNTPKVITKKGLTRVRERFSIHFRLADFGVKKSGLRVGKGRGMFDERFWEDTARNKKFLEPKL